MSKYVDEIVKDIRTNPQTWKRNGEKGIENGTVKISNCGNSSFIFLWTTSVASIEINGIGIWSQLTWFDSFRIEKAYTWWMQQASVELLSK